MQCSVELLRTGVSMTSGGNCGGTGDVPTVRSTALGAKLVSIGEILGIAPCFRAHTLEEATAGSIGHPTLALVSHEWALRGRRSRIVHERTQLGVYDGVSAETTFALGSYWNGASGHGSRTSIGKKARG